MSDHSLLPPNATPLERALDSCTGALDRLPVPHRQLLDAEQAAEQLLPWLAWELSVDEWDPSWGPQQKRASIAASISIHQHKGSIGSVREGLNGIGIGARVQEWFAMQPVGEPGTFALLVEVDQMPAVKQNVLQVVTVLANTKNLRSHLTDITISARSVNAAGLFGVAMMGTDYLLPAGDIQEAGVISEFAAAEALLNQITNIDLPQHIGGQHG